MRARLDLTGRRFGRLTAREDVGSRRGARLWRCECDCGAEVVVESHWLVAHERPHCSCRCPLREHQGRGRPPRAAAREEAKALRAAGLSYAAIGRRLGVSRQRAHQWLAGG